MTTATLILTGGWVGATSGGGGGSGSWDTASTEPTAAPGDNATYGEILAWLYALSRNKIIQTSTAQILYNSADTNTIATSAQSADNNSFYRDKWQ